MFTPSPKKEEFECHDRQNLEHDPQSGHCLNCHFLSSVCGRKKKQLSLRLTANDSVVDRDNHRGSSSMRDVKKIPVFITSPSTPHYPYFPSCQLLFLVRKSLTCLESKCKNSVAMARTQESSSYPLNDHKPVSFGSETAS